MALRQVAARRRRIERGRKQARRDEMTEVSRRQIRAIQSMTPMGAFSDIAKACASERQAGPEPTDSDDELCTPETSELFKSIESSITLATEAEIQYGRKVADRIARDEAEPPLERKG